MTAAAGFTVRIESTFENVRLLSRAVRAVCEELGASATDLDEVELGIDEVATNVVEHGYGGERGKWLSIAVSPIEGGVELVIEDEGKPIPGGLQTLPAGEHESAEPSLRGRGLFIVSQVLQFERYETEGGRNRLHLRKRFGATRPS